VVSLERKSDLYFPVISIPLKADGSYRFDHCGPGKFDLKIALPGKTDAKTAVTVGNADVKVPALAVRGTGTVTGQVFHPNGAGFPWPEAAGSIWTEDGKKFTFKADKEGRFRIEGVTLGKATVSVGWSEGCIYHSFYAAVQVQEGKTQEVNVTQREPEGPPPTP
jgi:hypothetical protein